MNLIEIQTNKGKSVCISVDSISVLNDNSVVRLEYSEKKMDLVVTLPTGPILGSKRKDIAGGIFLGYEGIPYGEAPLGKLRFKDPIPVKPWKEEKDCTKHGPGSVCKQIQTAVESSSRNLVKKWVLEGSEDCLNLNVYTRKLKSRDEDLKPVMVFIHGGAYVMGSTKIYGPERLMTKDIVLVQIHYRLGAFGFLYLHDPNLGVGGNAAMKDKVLALEWVKENISLFGGDPENVTLFGHSAGAASVAYLTMSPLASGLFHKAIIQSCSALTMSVRTYENSGAKLAEALGCDSVEESEILQFLQSLPPDIVHEGQQKFPDISYPCSYRMFSPRVESKKRKDAFMNQEPIELLKTGKYHKVPTMIGYTDMESILFMEFDKESPFNCVCFEEDTLTPVIFGFEQGSEEFKEVAEKIRKFYYGQAKPEYISLPTVKMFSDIVLIRGVIQTAKYLAKTSKQPTYLYRFSIPKDHGEPYSSKKLNGATHADELPYIFKMGKKTNAEFERHSERILKLWTDFAKCGNPTANLDDTVSVEWKPVEKNTLYYLDIGKELSLKTDPESDRMAFWDTLYQSYPHTKDY